MPDWESLTPAQRRVTQRAMHGTHRREVDLDILTLNDRLVRTLSNPFLGGQVEWDVTSSPSANLSCDVFDARHVLDWEDGEQRQYKARVVDRRFVVELDDWVEFVVFTGPLWTATRDAHRTSKVTLVAHSSERLAMGSVRGVFRRPRKARATGVVRDLCLEAGARRGQLRIPSLKATLPKRVTVGLKQKNRGKGKDDEKGKRDKKNRRIYRADHDDTYWAEIKRIAQAIDRVVFFDARERIVLQALPSRPSARLTSRQLLKPVVVERSVEGETVNTWRFLGGNPKGPAKQVTARLGFPRRHPLSAESLAWHGKPHVLMRTVRNKQVKRVKQARAILVRLRDRAIAELVSYEVECIPCLPWLRPYQLVAVETTTGMTRLRARQWRFPLGPGADPMVIGANRREGWKG